MGPVMLLLPSAIVLFTTNEAIGSFYKSLGVTETLGEDAGSGNLFIVDKVLALRGRKAKNSNRQKLYYGTDSRGT